MAQSSGGLASLVLLEEAADSEEKKGENWQREGMTASLQIIKPRTLILDRRRNMAEEELVCAVYGEGTVFPVTIARDAKVSALREAIFDKKRYKELYGFDASALTLYLARKEDGGWLKDDESLDALLKGDVDRQCQKMRSSWKLNDRELLGPAFQPGERDIHVLVELPTSTGVAPRQQSGLWQVRGSIENALSTRGVRCRLYRLAGAYLGYYDPARRIGDADSAFWYEDKTLCIHVLFKFEQEALQFENALREEKLTMGSPLNGQVVTATVDEVEGSQCRLRRVYYDHYVAGESESPQQTLSSLSSSSSVTVLGPTTDEFRFQRIEHEQRFLQYVNAESCHLVSRKQSRDHKREFAKYDRDPNNRLALSRDMHGYYDGLSCEFPIVNMIPGAVEQKPSIGNRYKVRSQWFWHV
ncbi:hypothetical protein BBJ28_00023164 [Nothophytophthora sp. Chile5]|nr:hypothetical protein BBJ28_00023164 [Nothophytophthora sp. Chile5]